MTLSPWLLATRPRTLAAGVVPVLVGTACAAGAVRIDWLVAAACLVGALLIQIGVNFANDAFDAQKGADTPDRLGPTRAVAAGLISARAMLIATAIVLTLALAIGLWLSTRGGWPILVLGLVSLVCAIAYTGGPFPLAYHGLGDLFVLLFFGFFAVIGSAWLQLAALPAPQLPAFAWWAAAGTGLQAVAIIAVNNLRDLATDARVGKRTLAVRLGDRGARIYLLLVNAAAAAAWWGCCASAHEPWLALAAVIATVGGVALAVGAARAQGRDLNRYLARSAAVELITGLSAATTLILRS